MTIFELEKDELLSLSDVRLEELVARLAEAELAQYGYSPGHAAWTGPITAADDKVDVRLSLPAERLDTGFLSRPNIIFQVKKPKMSASEITKEMRPKGELSEAISAQAERAGSYVIVSLRDDCSPPQKQTRLMAMSGAVADHPKRDSLHLDFMDRSRLLQWLRQHPAVVLWVRQVLGKAYSGWKPFGSWSNTPKGADDSLICAPGITITLPNKDDPKSSIEAAIEPMRELVRSGMKAVRITGLSGVGKTRIVQSLFEDSIGARALDHTIAIYVDTGDSPEPSVAAMLERLLAENRRAVLVVDNCPSDLHSHLAQKLASTESRVSLITIEYDIQDDKPGATDVVHIEADGPELAERLLMRRFPEIGRANANRIAELSNGNTRISLAIAERVEAGESLGKLSDADLFGRLFEQRKGPDRSLRTHAELLSLVYSFSVSASPSGIDELAVLGSIDGVTSQSLFRSVSELMRRHIAQKRADWRAILPQGIANRLASDALDNLPADRIREVFEASGNERLLMSFAHRLGMMHEHQIAQEIVEAWLGADGILGSLSALTEAQIRMLVYVTPVAPEKVLKNFEAEILGGGFVGFDNYPNKVRRTIPILVRRIAYEAVYFDRCMELLLAIADNTDSKDRYEILKNSIVQFFLPVYSGTHASLEQKLKVVRKVIASDDPGRRELGFSMLSIALSETGFISLENSDFGARPRDYGYWPDAQAFNEWHEQFMDIATGVAINPQHPLYASVRGMFSAQFRYLWDQEPSRGRLIEASRAMNRHASWLDGWRAVRSVINIDYRQPNSDVTTEAVPQKLSDLEEELAPKDLLDQIRAYAFARHSSYDELDEELFLGDDNAYHEANRRLQKKAMDLGQDFAISNHDIGALGAALFDAEYMHYGASFGRGLALGTHDHRPIWAELVDELHRYGSPYFNSAVFRGFIAAISEVDRGAGQELLDMCLQDNLLSLQLVLLHPTDSFDEHDFDRCLAALAEPDVTLGQYGELIWREPSSALPEGKILDLVQRILYRQNGDETVLDALAMKLHGSEQDTDALGPDLRRLGLQAAAIRLRRSHEDPGGTVDYKMNIIVGVGLSFGGNETEKLELLDALFSVVDQQFGFFHSFHNAIRTAARIMHHEFLNRIFCDDLEVRAHRRFFIYQGRREKLPLSEVDINEIIDWGQQQDEPEVWSFIAPGIAIWDFRDKEQHCVISKAGMVFLEAAPCAESVLKGYIDAIEVNGGWSGEIVREMELKTSALAMLKQHGIPDIAKATEKLLPFAEAKTESHREWTRERNKKREQRFE